MLGAEGWIRSDFPGIYTTSVEIGTYLDSMIVPINTQVEKFARVVQADPNLKDGFNLIGYSQGGLIARAYIERYNNPPVHNFISWVAPHGGVFGVPQVNQLCPDVDCPWLNYLFDELLDGNWTSDWLQKYFSFSTYWKDPFAYDDYLKFSTFLPDINNERPLKNATYKKNILSLNKMLLIYSEVDEVVVPNSSPWFQSYVLGQDVDVVPFRKTDQYLQDWLGLQTLDKEDRLIMESVPCTHHHIADDVCKPYYSLYTKPLLNNTLSL